LLAVRRLAESNAAPWIPMARSEYSGGTLKDNLDCELQQARRARLQDLAERRRFQVVHGSPKFGWLKQVEALRAELHTAGSSMLKYLNNETSASSMPGPRATLRPSLPN